MSAQIALETIKLDGGTQSRAGMDGPVVYEYAGLMRDGIEFPDVIIFYDGENYWLADGFHRVAAAKEADRTIINADIRQGGQREAVLYSVGANSAHGLRRSNGDKRRAVETLLRDEEWAKWSDREIARRCGVSAPFVGTIRIEIEDVNGLHLKERTGADGKTYSVKHWGLSNGMAFWQQVAKYRLNKEMVIGQLQEGATLLTDLSMSKDECWELLLKLAVDRTAKSFPFGSIVKHSTGRFGEVIQPAVNSIKVMDFRVNAENIWHVDDSTLSTLEEYEAVSQAEAASETPATPSEPETTHSGPEEFFVGDIVTVPSGHEGKVIELNGRNPIVMTVNGARAYNRAFLTLVSRAEDSKETIEEDQSSEDDDWLDLEYGTYPWRAEQGSGTTFIYDADDNAIANLYHNKGEGHHLARLIVSVVNAYYEALEAESKEETA